MADWCASTCRYYRSANRVIDSQTLPPIAGYDRLWSCKTRINEGYTYDNVRVELCDGRHQTHYHLRLATDGMLGCNTPLDQLHTYDRQSYDFTQGLGYNCTTDRLDLKPWYVLRTPLSDGLWACWSPSFPGTTRPGDPPNTRWTTDSIVFQTDVCIRGEGATWRLKENIGHPV